MKAKTIKSPLLIDTIQRYLLFIIGLFFSALGVAITKKGELGVSPISSVAYVMSIRLPQLSLGYWSSDVCSSLRSEERRVGKEGRSRWSPDH